MVIAKPVTLKARNIRNDVAIEDKSENDD
jgi:hypothetical protein